MESDQTVMGKRSTGSFDRVKRDYYPTPYSAIAALIAHLPGHIRYDEPCCGEKMKLMGHLARHGHICSRGTDIQTFVNRSRSYREGRDLFTLDNCMGDMFITNPPWPAIGKHGNPTVEMALHLSSIAPTWFLLSADFAHNKYYSRVAHRCVKIVSVGRVKWIDKPGSVPGKDNCAWYLFHEKRRSFGTLFFGR